MGSGLRQALANLNFYGPLCGGWRPYLKRWLEFTAPSGGGRWLYVCCGDARISRALAGAAPAADFVAVDADLSLAVASGEMPRNLRLVLADAAALPFADGGFDRVSISLGLHHMPPETRRAALNEAYRVLKPGGRLDVQEYHLPHHGLSRWRAAFYAWLDMSPYAWPMMADGALQREIEDAGFELKDQMVSGRGVLVMLGSVKRSARTSRS